MSSEINCIKNHDDFCFVCGNFIFMQKNRPDQKAVKTYSVDGPKFVEAYKNHFNRDPLERNVEWSPKVVCPTCYSKLTVRTSRINIESPMEWLVPEDHPNDCYFCKTIVPLGTNKRKMDQITYADVPSVKRAKFATEETTEGTHSPNIVDLSADIGEVSILSQPVPTDENVADDILLLLQLIEIKLLSLSQVSNFYLVQKKFRFFYRTSINLFSLG